MELLIWTIFCALVGLGCLGGVAWALVGGEDIGVEKIFLVLVWLLFATLFLGMGAWIAKIGPLRNLGKKKAAEAATESGEVKPAPAEKAAS